MKKRNHKKFLTTYIVLLLCLFLGFIVWWSENPSRKENLQKEEQSMHIFKPLQNDQISYLKIEKPDESIEIVKEDNTWKLKNDNNFLADQDLMKEIITDLNTWSTGEIVSKNSASYPNFNLSEDQAIGLQIGTDESNIQAHLYIGKKGPSFNSTYVRTQEHEQVVLVKKDLQKLLNKSVLDFREKTIWSLDPSTIKSVAIKSKTDKKVVTKNDQGLWTLEGLENADSEKLDGFLKILANVEAQGFSIDQNNKFEPGTEDTKLFVETIENDYYTLYIKEQEQKYYAYKENDQNTIYLLSSFLANQLSQDSGNFQITTLEENN